VCFVLTETPPKTPSRNKTKMKNVLENFKDFVFESTTSTKQINLHIYFRHSNPKTFLDFELNDIAAFNSHGFLKKKEALNSFLAVEFINEAFQKPQLIFETKPTQRNFQVHELFFSENPEICYAQSLKTSSHENT
jgi:hypothetical protein